MIMKVAFITGDVSVLDLSKTSYSFDQDWLNFYQNKELLVRFKRQYIEDIEIGEEEEFFP